MLLGRQVLSHPSYSEVTGWNPHQLCVSAQANLHHTFKILPEEYLTFEYCQNPRDSSQFLKVEGKK